MAYSSDLAPSDYHLLASLGHALAEQRFTLYENVQEWLDNWFDLKDEQFYWRGIHHLPERWEKCINSNGDSGFILLDLVYATRTVPEETLSV